MAIDNLLEAIRRNSIFRPDIPLETGFPGGPVVLRRNNPGVGIGEDWSWIHGGNRSVPTRPGDPGLFGKVDIRDAALGQSQQPERGSIEDILSSLYTPSTTYSDMYSKTLGEMPQRKEPSRGRKILGAIAAFSGEPNAREGVLYRNYNRDLADWETKMKYLQPAMTYERYANANERSNAYQTANTILRERQLAQQAEKDQRAADARDYANRIRQQIALGGEIVTDKNTGKSSIVRKDGSTIPLDITKLSPLDIEELRQTNRVANREDQQAYGREIEGIRQGNREDLRNLSDSLQRALMQQRYELMGELDQNKFGNPVQAFDKDGKPLDYMIQVNGKGDVRKIPLGEARTRVVPPGSGTGSTATQSETQKAQGITNKARQIASEHPEWKSYINFDPQDGKFTGIKKPFWSGNDETYNQVYKAIYGEPFTATPVKTGATKEAPKAPPGWKYVPKPGGGWTAVEDTNATASK